MAARLVSHISDISALLTSSTTVSDFILKPMFLSKFGCSEAPCVKAASVCISFCVECKSGTLILCVIGVWPLNTGHYHYANTPPLLPPLPKKQDSPLLCFPRSSSLAGPAKTSTPNTSAERIGGSGGPYILCVFFY